MTKSAQTRVPLGIGAIHFIGIGGIGMSGIAEIMHNLGYQVQGSDLTENPNVQRLKAMGIPIAIGQRAENVQNAHVAVYSSAIHSGNVELEAARAAGLPLVRRAEMLAEIMRLKSCVAVAGTNGKTTTTTMVAALLEAGGVDPTVVNGGIINSYGSNAYLGDGEWVVVEADESDGSFLRLPATVAVVTNIDPDHIDYYGSYDHLREAFRSFVENVPFYGFAVMCLDHPAVQTMVGQIVDRRVYTYGFSPQADARAVNLRFSEGVSYFDVVFTDRREGTQTTLSDLSLPMPGEHNVLDALAAIVVARRLDVSDQTIRTALAKFGGVRRRFTKVASWHGAAIIDDYGHNPYKIAAALKAARQAYDGPVVAVVQPHRFTRLRDTFEQFAGCLNDADVAVIAPVYPAGEAPIPGFDHHSYAKALQSHGHRKVLTIEGEADLAAAVAPHVAPGGAVVCLGAGSITGWAARLADGLDKLEGEG